MKRTGLLSFALLVAVSGLVSANRAHATYPYDCGNICNETVDKVKSGAGYTCYGRPGYSCDCNTYAVQLGYGGASCMPGYPNCATIHGTGIAGCNDGTVCCAGGSGKDAPTAEPQPTEPQDSTTADISATLSGQEPESRTSAYWGYYNSTLKSPSAGAARNCTAKIHVCFIHGFSDLSGVTDQNSCNNACNSATNTNQDECYDTDCSSRCGGWWGATDSCS